MTVVFPANTPHPQAHKKPARYGWFSNASLNALCKTRTYDPLIKSRSPVRDHDDRNTLRAMELGCEAARYD